MICGPWTSPRSPHRPSCARRLRAARGRGGDALRPLDAYVHVFFTPDELVRFGELVTQAGRERDLEWLSLDPLVPLGPGARRSVIGIDVRPAIVERNRTGGVFGVLGRLSARDGQAERSLLALGHPGGAWLEWLARP